MLQTPGPSEYKVFVKVVNPEGQPNVFYMILDPERVLLDGSEGNKIIWTMKSGAESLATFAATSDIEFMTEEGRARFDQWTFDPSIENGQITAMTKGTEKNETIFTYFVNSHLIGSDFVIRVDPEVDNPPPPRP
jgi:hypothetical protein